MSTQCIALDDCGDDDICILTENGYSAVSSSLCSSGCGFYGNPRFGGLCSKCSGSVTRAHKKRPGELLGDVVESNDMRRLRVDSDAVHQQLHIYEGSRSSAPSSPSSITVAPALTRGHSVCSVSPNEMRDVDNLSMLVLADGAAQHPQQWQTSGASRVYVPAQMSTAVQLPKAATWSPEAGFSVETSVVAKTALFPTREIGQPAQGVFSAGAWKPPWSRAPTLSSTAVPCTSQASTPTPTRALAAPPSEATVATHDQLRLHQQPQLHARMQQEQMQPQAGPPPQRNCQLQRKEQQLPQPQEQARQIELLVEQQQLRQQLRELQQAVPPAPLTNSQSPEARHDQMPLHQKPQLDARMQQEHMQPQVGPPSQQNCQLQQKEQQLQQRQEQAMMIQSLLEQQQLRRQLRQLRELQQAVSPTALMPQQQHAIETPLTPQQQRVIDMVLQEKKSIFFTGSAGTGKSTTLHALVRHAPRDKTRVTALTGIAASALPGGATTLHSFAGIGLGKGPKSQVLEMVKNNRAKTNAWKECDLLIVDEASMMSKALFELLDYIARQVRDSEKPFGGLQLCLCGDFFQLPPVSRGASASSDQGKFCFESDAWHSCIQHSVELTTVFRQKDARLVDLLTQVRFNRADEAALQLLQSLSRPLDAREGILPTRLYPANTAVDKINKDFLDRLDGESICYQACDTFSGNTTGHLGFNQQELTTRLNSLMLHPQYLELKVGAQVMMLKNQGGLVNGSRGRVVDFQDMEGPGQLPGAKVVPIVHWHQGATSAVSPDEATRETPQGVMCRRQLPLKLCWAMTIHKAQGMTIDLLEVDLANVFEKGQAYVALSRARTLDGLRVASFDPRRFWTDNRVVQYYQECVVPVEKI